ncbi:hypothetical protein [Streptacidiphilus sp. P02-A3a]|uniref:hypothetical protein n=1 Tax=Streptacidiphilus sp. P02-A3a TaxID=2704468 RepID=UPI0015FD7F5D|nr:hypothetical protein [Streptacidiphilus sp. P02-A3a]QMU72010.1 hypothetical protein GXP74_31025 [Streptacidiphilus sp. P02-A3a]
MVHISLVCRNPGGADIPSKGQILDILWAHATQADQLEHVSAHSCSDRVHLLFFFRERLLASPEEQAFELLRRCYAASPLLASGFLPGADPQSTGPDATAPPERL